MRHLAGIQKSFVSGYNISSWNPWFRLWKDDSLLSQVSCLQNPTFLLLQKRDWMEEGRGISSLPHSPGLFGNIYVTSQWCRQTYRTTLYCTKIWLNPPLIPVQFSCAALQHGTWRTTCLHVLAHLKIDAVFCSSGDICWEVSFAARDRPFLTAHNNSIVFFFLKVIKAPINSTFFV